jgi:hypothetical protein
VLFAPSFGAVGIAWSAVIAQLYTLVAYSILAWRAGLNPFARTTPIAQSSLSPSSVAKREHQLPNRHLLLSSLA